MLPDVLKQTAMIGALPARMRPLCFPAGRAQLVCSYYVHGMCSSSLDKPRDLQERATCTKRPLYSIPVVTLNVTTWPAPVPTTKLLSLVGENATDMASLPTLKARKHFPDCSNSQIAILSGGFCWARLAGKLYKSCKTRQQLNVLRRHRPFEEKFAMAKAALPLCPIAVVADLCCLPTRACCCQGTSRDPSLPHHAPPIYAAGLARSSPVSMGCTLLKLSRHYVTQECRPPI